MAYVNPPTFVSSTTATAADVNILGADIVYLYGVAQGVVFSGTKVRRAAATSLTTATWTPVTWTSEIFDYGGWYSSGTDIIVPSGAIPAGYTTIACLAIVRAKFASNSTGTRQLRININGTPEIAPSVPAANGDVTVLGHTEPIIVASGDVVTMDLYQTSGGALNASEIQVALLRYAPAA